MIQSNAVWDQVKPFLMAFYTHARWWIAPTIVLTIGSLIYAVFMPTNWRASQAVLVRDAAIGSQGGPGEFTSIDLMKVYQEKILEVARSRTVVEATLKRLGPPDDFTGDSWPTDDAILGLQMAITLSAPKGAEFGRTEFFHISVVGKTKEEALARTRVVCDELERNLGDLKDANAQSVVKELERAQTLALADLETATAKLEVIEREVGEDLGELRLLTENGSGDSNLRTSLNQVKQEVRQAENSRESLLQLRDLLDKAQQDSNTLLATPSRLLESQPGLRSLKDGLTTARLECSRLRGVMSESHPKLQAAMRAEQQVRRQLQEEVTTARLGVEADLASNAAQLATMKTQQQEIEQRLDKLAGVRARYANLVADARQRSESLDAIKQKLAEAQAAQNAAGSASQLTRFGEPVVGDRPTGPSKKLVVAGGMGAGMTLGAGLVFLFMPLAGTDRPRRWSDYLNMGRRASDHFFGRRASDTSYQGPMGPGTTVSAMMSPPVEGRPCLPPVIVGGRRATDIPATPPTPTSPEGPGEGDRRGRTGRRASDRT